MNAAIIDSADLLHATQVHLEFTNQKNGKKGEAISHGDTNELLMSPLKAVQ
jgi:hypothetical protein